jgi:flagellar motor switch/type III secretory pathway protein FliN
METAVPIHEPKSLGNSGAAWSLAKRLRCRLSVEVSVPAFTVRELLRLEPGGIVQTEVAEGSMLPLRANGQIIARGEFEVMGMQLAVRILELS